jgi:excisionase family DNA binding protein
VSEAIRQLPRLALTKNEAAESLGMSVDSLERYVMPHVRVVRRGRLVLISVNELQAWLEQNAARTLE